MKKKRRILAVVMALVALMMCSLTSLAKVVVSGTVRCSLERRGNGSWAKTETVDPNNPWVYVALTEEYMSSLGNIYVSSPVINTSNSEEIEATYNPNGSFVSAWSDHGHRGKEYTMYI